MKINQDITMIENEIDTIIYKIYDFNFKEVLLIDPLFPLSQEEYENYEINEQ